MKKITLLISLSIVTSIVAQENIIKNSGFEFRTGEPQADDWISGASIDRYKKHKKEGEYSMRLTSQAEGIVIDMYQDGYTDPDLGVYVYHEIEPETIYALNYWVLDNTEKATLKHKIIWLDENRYPIEVTGDDPLVNPTESSVDNSEWKKITAESKSPKNAKHLSVKFYTTPQNGQSGGSIYLDEIFFGKENNFAANNINLKNYTHCYYNPSESNLNIIVENDVVINNVELFSTLGERIMIVGNKANQKKMKIALNKDMQKGVYIIRINTNKGAYTKKFIK